MARDRIRLESLEVSCVVGVRPDEREREQLVQLDVEMGLDASGAAYSGRISRTVDYVRAADEIEALLKFRRYRLLEMAAEEIAAMLLGVHPMLSEVKLSLRKPEALAGRARAAAVGIQRNVRDFQRRRETPSFGEVEVLFETREAGLYLLHVEPGRSIPPHFHRIMRELEWLADGELLRDGVPIADFSPVSWEHERVHTYENASKRRATLFCCDCPPFVAQDEVVVEPT